MAFLTIALGLAAAYQGWVIQYDFLEKLSILSSQRFAKIDLVTFLVFLLLCYYTISSFMLGFPSLISISILCGFVIGGIGYYVFYFGLSKLEA